MRVIVVGLGVQGHKRRKFAGADFVASVDPVNADAQYRDLRDVPLADYDAALCCIPDGPKMELLGYLVGNGKHVLVEKPLWAAADAEISALQEKVRKSGVVCYTAYNHRFEPHFVRMRDLIAGGSLGKIYSCRMFYGNGTARLVRESAWRDHGSGVLHDLGSHLLDTARFWFGDLGDDFAVQASNAFENRAPDHVVFASESSRPRLQFEMTLLSWRNHFTCDIFAENGTAHIESLCKWGPSRFTVRRRVLPSGRPPEEAVTLVQDDPTWEAEYAHFKRLCQGGARTDLTDDLWLNAMLRRLGEAAEEKAA
ncbi:MAG TPA: Gfo/Idh/MocA family oxidoreductase [Alphaproteobacteria bacterium]|nr:Gfo/Idh/MocA family oxidoreductase [Alphaproteobacteria bacterium]